VDECDYGFLGTYRKILDHFSSAKVLGITGTVDRLDGENLGSFYQSIAYKMNVAQGMTAPPPGPYLCRFQYHLMDVQIDLRKLRPGKDDFSDEDLEARIAPVVGLLANSIKKELIEIHGTVDAARTLIFTPMVASAQAIAEALRNDLGVNAEWSAGEDPEREAKVARFRSGETRVLASCSLFNRGFDVPEVTELALCRPTKSIALLSQQMGRGVRRHPGKERCHVLDWDYLTDDYDLARPVDIFVTPDMDEETLGIAREMMTKDRQPDLLEAVERAQEVHRERQVMRIKVRERELKYNKMSFDPLTMADVMDIPWRGPRLHQVKYDKATPNQVKCLEGFGIKGAEEMSRTRASTWITFLKQRQAQGYARPRMVAALIAKGDIDPRVAREMKYEEASDRLDEIFGRLRGVC
jgi:superfamily II DNA or RNA helicase